MIRPARSPELQVRSCAAMVAGKGLYKLCACGEWESGCRLGRSCFECGRSPIVAEKRSNIKNCRKQPHQPPAGTWHV